MTAKEGRAFRPEVLNLAALSPRMGSLGGEERSILACDSPLPWLERQGKRRTAINYNVEDFRLPLGSKSQVLKPPLSHFRYNKRRKKNVLTESTVLALPAKLLEGEMNEDCGVQVQSLDGAGTSGRAIGVYVVCQLLATRDFACRSLGVVALAAYALTFRFTDLALLLKYLQITVVIRGGNSLVRGATKVLFLIESTTP